LTYLDTHVVLWLHDGESHRLTAAARRQIARGDLRVSPAVLLEIEFLHEIRRLRAGAAAIMAELSERTALQICDLAFSTVLEAALPEAWVRDPFDRLIVAQASANRAALITKDELIRRNYRRAVW
jgi:PIN domain nuclease of toxin-antitoxin system